MRLANMAAGARHEAKEKDELRSEAGSAGVHDEEAAEERWYHSEDEDIKCLLDTGEHESSTAQRTSHPGYPKLETRSFQNFDWRHETIVSSFPNELLYLYNAWPPLFTFSLHAGSCHLLALHCVSSVLIVLCHSFLLCRSFLLTTIFLLSTTFVARQPYCFIHHFAILQTFQHNDPTTLSTSLAGQLTTILPAFEVNFSTFNNSELQRTHCYHGCL